MSAAVYRAGRRSRRTRSAELLGAHLLWFAVRIGVALWAGVSTCIVYWIVAFADGIFPLLGVPTAWVEGTLVSLTLGFAIGLFLLPDVAVPARRARPPTP